MSVWDLLPFTQIVITKIYKAFYLIIISLKKETWIWSVLIGKAGGTVIYMTNIILQLLCKKKCVK